MVVFFQNTSTFLHSMHSFQREAARAWQWRRVALHEGYEGLDREAVFAPLFAALHSTACVRWL